MLFGSWAELAPSLGPEPRLRNPRAGHIFVWKTKPETWKKKDIIVVQLRSKTGFEPLDPTSFSFLPKSRYRRLGVRTMLVGRHKKKKGVFQIAYNALIEKIKVYKNSSLSKIRFDIMNCVCKINIFILKCFLISFCFCSQLSCNSMSYFLRRENLNVRS